MSEEKEWSEEVIILAKKIHSLNNLLDSYKSQIDLYDARLRKLRNENNMLKASLGHVKLQKDKNEKERNKDTDSNNLGFGDFETIS